MSLLKNSASPLSVAIDIGGTFSDVTLLDRKSGKLWTAKTPSTPHDPSIGFMDGIEKALAQAGLRHDHLGQVVHGTTVATNLILEAKGAVTGLLTTAGFRHVLEIGRHDIPRKSNMYSWTKPIRPVQPERIMEVPGMLRADGSELVPLDESAVRQAAHRLKALNVKSVAICFLHSYSNPAHEQRARDVLIEEWPDVMISLSSEVLPVFREFERSMATILNAYVMPAVSTYVARLEKRLHEKEVKAPLLLMKSSGGVTGTETIRREPVQTALSGPAAGVVGAQLTAKLAGFRNVIGVDIGGTSADISLIKDGDPGMTMHGRVGDWPLTLPMVDINTIGAGGGSIARVSAEGILTVGPESAGAQPGPVCYMRGGTEPTVTDAHVALGNLPPSLLEGAMTLDVEAARQAIQQKVAIPLGLSIEEAARGILAIVDNAMVGAIRVVSVERGHDPRDFALIPFGGAGPLHGGALARLLGIKTILVPPSPGVLSAIGLLVSNLKSDYSRTCVQHPNSYNFEQIAQVFSEMEGDAEKWFETEGVPVEGRHVQRLASLRYLHQGFELQVPWTASTFDAAALAEAITRFHEQHLALYTFAQEDMPVEIVTLHVEAVGKLETPALPENTATGTAADALVGHQDIHYAEGTQSVPIFARVKLGAGVTITGPAIFMQLDTTTTMLPGQTGTVDRYGNLIVTENN